jgi:drug/metabolite transporter (DMT)-like permease
VFGKFAIRAGMPPMTVVGLRTLFASLLLLLVIWKFKRAHLYIYPAGLLGCLLAGGLNGLGSLLYYGALGRIDASLGQMIYSLYPLFVALWMWLDRHPTGRLTLIRLLLVIPALLLLTGTGSHAIDRTGILMMLGASALYALHLPINQHVLYDMPAPTVTLYTLLAMSVVVTPAMYLSGFHLPNPLVAVLDGGQPLVQPLSNAEYAWGGVVALTLVTFFSRLTLFMGVKNLGGLQTALLGLGELLVTITFSHLWLHERFTLAQWVGVILLVISLALVKLEKPPGQRQGSGGWLSWLRPKGQSQLRPGVRAQLSVGRAHNLPRK